MDRRHFLHTALGLSALPLAQAASTSTPEDAWPVGGRTPLVEAARLATKGLRPGTSITLSTGLKDVDRMVGETSPGSLVVVASRPSLGKTLLVLQIADYTARVTRRAVMIACANEASTSAKRLISLRTGVHPDAIIRGWPIDEDKQRLVRSAVAHAYTVPIFLDGTPYVTVGDMEDLALKFAGERAVPLGAIIIDGNEMLIRERQRSASDAIAARLHLLSEALHVPVIVTAGVSRAIEERHNKRPRITDFAGADAAFVRAADLVLTIYRDEIYEPKSPDVGRAEISLLKHAYGRQGTALVRLSEGRFEDC